MGDQKQAALLSEGVAVPTLQPLANSFVATQVEKELQALFISLFQSMLRGDERTINVMGMPHLGSFELIERNVKNDGLALYRGADEGAMRYLYNAWRARNRRRGLAFTQLYLQLLFPNDWMLVQQWQDKSKPYPLGLVDQDGGNHWLTSRVRVEIGDAANTQAVIAVISALRSTVPARIVLTVRIVPDDTFADNLAIANGVAGLQSGTFTGTVQ